MPTKKRLRPKPLTEAQAVVKRHMHQSDIAKGVGQTEAYVSQQLKYDRPLTDAVANYVAKHIGYETAGELTRLCREARAVSV